MGPHGVISQARLGFCSQHTGKNCVWAGQNWKIGIGWKDYQNGLAWTWRQLEHFAGLGIAIDRLQDFSTFQEEGGSAIIVSFVFER